MQESDKVLFGFCFYLKVGMFSLVRCNLPYDKLQ